MPAHSGVPTCICTCTCIQHANINKGDYGAHNFILLFASISCWLPIVSCMCIVSVLYNTFTYTYSYMYMYMYMYSYMLQLQVHAYMYR